MRVIQSFLNGRIPNHAAQETALPQQIDLFLESFLARILHEFAR